MSMGLHAESQSPVLTRVSKRGQIGVKFIDRSTPDQPAVAEAGANFHWELAMVVAERPGGRPITHIKRKLGLVGLPERYHR